MSREALNLSIGSQLLFSSFRLELESRLSSNLSAKTNLDAGVRRHDTLALRLKHAQTTVEAASDFDATTGTLR